MPDATIAPDNLTFTDLEPATGNAQAEAIDGLLANRKKVNPKWFYDERGSELFDAITQQPEYYQTRTETGLLRQHATEIASHCPSQCLLVEPGSGSCEKVRYLLEALQPSAYVPIDISSDFLHQAARALAREYPWLSVHAVCADFNSDWSFLEAQPSAARVVFYPGSTIGNLEPLAARQFLRQVRDIIGSTGGAIIGVDLHKSTERLNAAYNDSRGVTAQFNLNLLSHLNESLDASFDPQNFDHEAFYNEDERRIEMHLVSTRSHSVPVNGTDVVFDNGERIHTENSYKYSIADFSRLAESAGLKVQESWTDNEDLFSVHYLSANPSSEGRT